MYWAWYTDPLRDWRLGIFWDLRDWGLGPGFSLHLADKTSYYRVEVHLYLGPIDLQYIKQKNKF